MLEIFALQLLFDCILVWWTHSTLCLCGEHIWPYTCVVNTFVLIHVWWTHSSLYLCGEHIQVCICVVNTFNLILVWWTHSILYLCGEHNKYHNFLVWSKSELKLGMAVFIRKIHKLHSRVFVEVTYFFTCWLMLHVKYGYDYYIYERTVMWSQWQPPADGILPRNCF